MACSFIGKLFETTQLMNYAASSVIFSIVYGQRFEYTDPQLRNMVDRANESIRLSGTASVQIYNMFPFLGPWLKNWRLRMKNLALDIKEVSELESGEKSSLFNQQNLIFSVGNLFAAGTDTTSTTLPLGLLLMAKYSHIQDGVQEGIDQMIGGRQPGTCVFPFQMSVLWDEDEWETPHTFNPKHFLDEHGRFVKRDIFLPFSAGHKVCLGESLARMELFLFFTSLLQYFRFTLPLGVSEDDLDLTPVVGFILNPVPHKLCAVKRL